MNNVGRVIELFATPIYVTEIPPKLSTICNYFNELKHSTTESDDISVLDYGTHSENTYLMDEPECKDIANFILENVTKWNDECLGYDVDGWQFSQSWVSHKHPGQRHIMHTHPNSVISAVFFYGPVEEKSSTIRFHDTKIHHNTLTMMVSERKDNKVKKTLNTHEFYFNPGTLLIFPSYLPHSVGTNKTRLVRKSVSMNIVPKNNVGDRGSLTELLYNKLV
jgi:uncharacterized protein (TIGR02466 family)